MLFAGTYFLDKTIVFTSKHSNIKVTTHPSNEEDAVVSGGIPLKNVMWKPYDTSGDKNIYVANIKDSVQHSKAATPVPGLQWGNARLELVIRTSQVRHIAIRCPPTLSFS